jgi:selenocysteine-specific elongation factor
MFVLGTAGHIDHGKSALVKAMTGMDPDRLQEEKERGMTIDLGFAWMKLPSGQEVGIVDVPGHERFIKNMLAGVGGIDLALLVIAANEAVMPQTTEHLAILDLLGISLGIVVITKTDLVDLDWLGLVTEDIRKLIKPTIFCKAPIVPVSAVNGEGIAELKATIDRLLAQAEPKKDVGRPRLPVDRIFTISGSGTVVTGTLIDGTLSVGEEVEIVPNGIKSRLRGLQTHKARVDKAEPGSRVAANLVGVDVDQIRRGDVLTRPGSLAPTSLISVQLRLLPYLRRPLQHNASVSFHSGAAESPAKVRLLENEKLQPGEITWAQFVLKQPIALVKGDRYIVRSPIETLGGGVIIEAHAERLRRFRPSIFERLNVQLEGGGESSMLAAFAAKEPLEFDDLKTKSQLPETEVKMIVESLIQQGNLVRVGEGEHALLYTAQGMSRIADSAVSQLKEYHEKYPIRAGMPKAELGNRLKLGKYSQSILQWLAAAGKLNDGGISVCLPDHRVKLSAQQQLKIAAFLKSLVQNPYSPPGDQIPDPDILNLLIEQHKVVKVTEGVVFDTAVYEGMVQKVTAHIKVKGKVTLAEVRDLFNTSRKYAQAFLEYLDEQRITRRSGDERVLFQG